MRRSYSACGKDTLRRGAGAFSGRGEQPRQQMQGRVGLFIGQRIAFRAACSHAAHPARWTPRNISRDETAAVRAAAVEVTAKIAPRASSLLSSSSYTGKGKQGQQWAAALATAAAAGAAAFAASRSGDQQYAVTGGGGVVLCKGGGGGASKSSEEAVGDYQSRLLTLTTLDHVFSKYASAQFNDGSHFMTSGDFMQSMLAYTFTRLPAKEIRRRCNRYRNELLGNASGLISRQEFSFLVSLLAIPAEHFDVALAVIDADGDGVITLDEFTQVTNQLLKHAGTDGGGGEGGAGGGGGGGGGGSPDGGGSASSALGGSANLRRAWFGEDGSKTITTGEFHSFVKMLREDVRRTEVSLYSRLTPAKLALGEEAAAELEGAAANKSTTGTGWWGWGLGLLTNTTTGEGTSTPSSTSTVQVSSGWTPAAATASDGKPMVESISIVDLALTLVSSSSPKQLRMSLQRIGSMKKKRSQVPLDDALHLHAALEDYCDDLEMALSIYCQGTGGTVGEEDFARAVKVVTGRSLSPACSSLVLYLFDESGDGVLDYPELLLAMRERRQHQLGTPLPPPGLRRFLACVKGAAD